MGRHTAVKVSDLPTMTGQPWQIKRPVLYCERCGGEYSAERGDYFLRPDDYVFKCCGRNMQLVTFRRVVEPWVREGGER